MGCCVSTAKDNKSNRASPPIKPFVEEETVVKEVLSETPSLHKSRSSRFCDTNDLPTKMAIPLSPYASALLPKLQDEKQQQNNRSGGVSNKPPRMIFSPSDDHYGVFSEKMVSTGGHYRDNVTEIRQGSPAKHRNRQISGDRTESMSLARRSPRRVGSGSGCNSGRFMGNGQSCDRRSRSPVTRVDGSGSRTSLGRSPSMRELGKSPGRVGSGLSGRTLKMEHGCRSRREQHNQQPPTSSSNESLENPLVSLECFIFL